MGGHRLFTYVILVINALFLIWLIAGLGTMASDPPAWCYMPGEGKAWPGLCRNPRTTLAGFIIFRWVMVDVILGVVWLATNGRYKAKKAAEAAPAAASAQ
jgi:hypothetical protein